MPDDLRLLTDESLALRLHLGYLQLETDQHLRRYVGEHWQDMKEVVVEVHRRLTRI